MIAYLYQWALALSLCVPMATCFGTSEHVIARGDAVRDTDAARGDYWMRLGKGVSFQVIYEDIQDKNRVEFMVGQNSLIAGKSSITLTKDFQVKPSSSFKKFVKDVIAGDYDMPTPEVRVWYEKTKAPQDFFVTIMLPFTGKNIPGVTTPVFTALIENSKAVIRADFGRFLVTARALNAGKVMFKIDDISGFVNGTNASVATTHKPVGTLAQVPIEAQ